jgi:hypothetical protein
MNTEVNKPKTGGLIFLIVIVLIIIGSCNMMTSGPSDSEIRIAVEDAIQPNLYNPSGAEFSGSSDTTINEKEDGVYIVHGYVESTNAFGAPIRNNYRATVTDDDGDLDVYFELQNAITGEWE